MKTLSILLVVVLVLSLAGAAFAADTAGVDSGGEVKEKDGRALAGLMFVPALLLLLALPAVVVYRAFARFPERIADTLGERPVFTVALGVAHVILLVLLATAGEASPAIGVVAAILWLVFLVVVMVGLCGTATKLARKFRADAGIGTFALAWLTISGISLLPVLGLLYLLWLVSGAIGGTLLTVYAGRGKAVTA